jgi:hypothetical protein
LITEGDWLATGAQIVVRDHRKDMLIISEISGGALKSTNTGAMQIINSSYGMSDISGPVHPHIRWFGRFGPSIPPD